MILSKPRKILLIHSPHSGRSAQLPEAITFLYQAKIEITNITSIAELDNLPPQGTYWKESGIDVAVAAGGDGLVGGVITHLAESGLILGILPLGTANDIARSIGIPQNLRQAVEVIAQGQIVAIDIGTAQPAQQAPHLASPEHHKPVPASVAPQKYGFFAHTLTVGANVDFARQATNIATRQRYGKLTYPVAAFEVLRNPTRLDLEMHLEGLTSVSPTQQHDPTMDQKPVCLHYRTLLVAVINAPIFGGAMQLSLPGASISDRLLDIVVVDADWEKLGTTFTRIFNHSEQAPWHTTYPELHAAELSHIPGIHHIRAKGVLIRTDIDPQDVTLDGEVRGQTPIHACVADEQLRVLAPPQPKTL